MEVVKNQKIGEGAHARVYQGTTSTGGIVAVKCVQTDSERAANAAKEYELLRKLAHPNIVQVIGYQYTRELHTADIIMEYATGGTLAALLERAPKLDFSTVAMWGRQITEGTIYLHSKHIVHRDIKPSNLLLVARTGGDPSSSPHTQQHPHHHTPAATSSSSAAAATPPHAHGCPLHHTAQQHSSAASPFSLKIADFGFSELLTGAPSSAAGQQQTQQQHSPPQCVGTLPYMPAPAVRGEVWYTNDVYAVGCTLLEIVTRERPWEGIDAGCMREHILSGRIPPQLQGLVDGVQRHVNGIAPSVRAPAYTAPERASMHTFIQAALQAGVSGGRQHPPNEALLALSKRHPLQCPTPPSPACSACGGGGSPATTPLGAGAGAVGQQQQQPFPVATRGSSTRGAVPGGAQAANPAGAPRQGAAVRGSAAAASGAGGGRPMGAPEGAHPHHHHHHHHGRASSVGHEGTSQATTHHHLGGLPGSGGSEIFITDGRGWALRGEQDMERVSLDGYDEADGGGGGGGGGDDDATSSYSTSSDGSAAAQPHPGYRQPPPASTDLPQHPSNQSASSSAASCDGAAASGSTSPPVPLIKASRYLDPHFPGGGAGLPYSAVEAAYSTLLAEVKERSPKHSKHCSGLLERLADIMEILRYLASREGLQQGGGGGAAADQAGGGGGGGIPRGDIRLALSDYHALQRYFSSDFNMLSELAQLNEARAFSLGYATADAERLLKLESRGSYILRPSGRLVGSLVLSAHIQNAHRKGNLIGHFLLTVDSDSQLALGEMEKAFPSQPMVRARTLKTLLSSLKANVPYDFRHGKGVKVEAIGRHSSQGSQIYFGHST